jgi:hypothetical protein
VKPEAYEFIPFTAVVPATPSVGAGSLVWDEIVQRETLRIAGVASDVFAIEPARREAEQRLRECRRRLESGDRYALLELLDDNAAFILVDWVRETLLRLLKGGLPLRHRGRIRGKHLVEPRIVGCLVGCLVTSGEVPNREEAFRYLADKGLASYHTIRGLYYRGHRDSRFSAVYFEYPEGKFQVPAPAAEALLRRTRMLEAGSRLEYHGEDPQRDRCNLTMTAR